MSNLRAERWLLYLQTGAEEQASQSASTVAGKSIDNLLV
jgi:hypothetical protein